MSAASSTPDSRNPLRRFSRAALAEYDGSVPGRTVLIGYRGRVYDVSRSFMWLGGRHFSLRAGRDLTARLAEAPHGAEMPTSMPCVGVLVGDGEAG